jgi:methylthioribose-1-phosphate isomerase
MAKFYTLKWCGNYLSILDQRKLPDREVYLSLKTYMDVISAIKNLSIRGAPAIGAAGAFGCALGALQIKTKDIQKFSQELNKICNQIAGARPTAVNLSWAVKRVKSAINSKKFRNVNEIRMLILREAKNIYNEDIKSNIKIGEYGEKLIPEKAKILTHCNAGALATCGYGTALGVIRSAYKKGKIDAVYADETRPVLQGARLTAWELQKDGIPVTVITDNMAGNLMKSGNVDIVIVGADRITLNGDFANKIGTYSLAVLAKHHGIPFYVAAPQSTFDLNLKSGDDIIIEMRDKSEVLNFRGKMVAPAGVDAFNPAFDVTPHELVTAFITNRGIIKPPFIRNIKKVMSK